MILNNMNFKDTQFKGLKFVFGVLSILFLLVLIIWFGVGTFNKIKEGEYIGKNIEERNLITVSGTGEVYAKPDLALISFSVVTEKKEVSEAMKENAEKMNKIINSLKEKEVEEKDLKTTTFSVNPRYEWRDLEFSKGERVLVGYEVRQVLEVKIRNLEKIGEIIKTATNAGANQVSGLQLTIDKQEELQSQARKEAIEKAKQRAGELAEQLGIKLVRITSFNEGWTTYPIRYDFMKESAIGMGGEESPQIETGENKIEISVTITYEIN